MHSKLKNFQKYAADELAKFLLPEVSNKFSTNINLVTMQAYFIEAVHEIQFFLQNRTNEDINFFATHWRIFYQ